MCRGLELRGGRPPALAAAAQARARAAAAQRSLPPILASPRGSPPRRCPPTAGTTEQASEQKKGYKLPRHVMANGDLARLINSDEIQSVVKPQASSLLARWLGEGLTSVTE